MSGKPVKCIVYWMFWKLFMLECRTPFQLHGFFPSENGGHACVTI